MLMIASGVTDQVITFFAADATDLITPETGLSSFTVYRSRNGGTPAAFTTPTVTELDSTNMPGWYKLLLDEDMTIDSGDETQDFALHITHAGMAPARLKFILFRPKITAGNTLDVTSGGAAGIDWGNVENPTTTLNLSATTVKTATDVETDTADIQSRIPAALTAGGNIKADALAVSGSTTAANNVEVVFDTDFATNYGSNAWIVALNSDYEFAKGTEAMTESYAANGVAPTPIQALYGIQQILQMFGISGTSLTVKKLDNATTAFVVTLNDATSPTGAART